MNFTKLIKSIYKKLPANILLNSEKIDAFPLKTGKSKNRPPFLSISYWKS